MIPAIFCLKHRFIHLLQQSLQGFSSDRVLTPTQIPLKLLRGYFPVTYQSPIAHRLAGQLNQSAITIATQLLRQIQSKSTEFFLFPDPGNNKLGQPDFTLQVMPSGMILLELTDVGLAQWLHQMTQIFPVDTDTPPHPEFPNSLFAVQYSHARCCSLLQRANREGLITLTSAQTYKIPRLGRLDQPDPLPWLTASQQLQCCHPAEQALMAQLITTVDYFYTTSPSAQWFKLAHDLSQAFQQFYSHCRIWGDVKQQTPQLAQARLGLVWITQWLLQLILQEQLNAMAPLEL
jgi:hypothetical protein